MNDNKLVAFFEKFLGVIIGVIIGILVLAFSVLRQLFDFILVIGICGWVGNYIHKNKEKVKTNLKKWIDKM